ncbi:MAG: porin family protein [Endomicrobium sp.]|jgi:hypothetical protein|nr:porin family protein [Endomicrobium sp.]
MKKILAAVLMTAVAAVNVLAFDWYAGTSLNFHTLSGDDAEGSYFAIAPEIGYIFSDKIDAGVGFGYESDDKYNATSVKTDTWSVIPFVRYKAFAAGSFAFYARLQLSYGSSKVDGEDESIDTFGVAALPVVEYAISDRFTLWTSFGALSYTTVSSGDNSVSDFGLDLDMNALTFGFAVNF